MQKTHGVVYSWDVSIVERRPSFGRSFTDNPERAHFLPPRRLVSPSESDMAGLRTYMYDLVESCGANVQCERASCQRGPSVVSVLQLLSAGHSAVRKAT